MPKTELDGLPVIDADESEEITVAVRSDDMQAGDTKSRTPSGSYCPATQPRRR